MDSETIPTTILPEDLPAFRVAQLLVVLEGIASSVTVERLAYYDFFLANPMLIDSIDTVDRTALVMAGFDSRTIDHQSAAQRFANRRQRIRADIASLVAYGLVYPIVAGGLVKYELTELGVSSAAELRAAYADGLRRSISISLPTLRKLSDSSLRKSAQVWLRAERFGLDLIGLDDGLLDSEVLI